MELLTPDGWSPATAINSLVMSIRAMLLAGDARLLTTDPKAKEARRPIISQSLLRTRGDAPQLRVPTRAGGLRIPRGAERLYAYRQGTPQVGMDGP